MKTMKIKVYSYSELSEEAKERAWRKYLEKGYEYLWSGEARDTITAFENEFGITIRDWCYDSCSYSFDIDFCSWDADVLNLCGNRARAYFWNHYEKILLTGRYRSKFHGTKNAHSRFVYDRVYNGTCPLTGYCLDCDALDPLAYFCFGVKWDEGTKKRIPIRPTIAQDNRNTVESILRDCVDSLFHALQKDCEWHESQEYFADYAEANGYEFTEKGDEWDGYGEVVAA